MGPKEPFDGVCRAVPQPQPYDLRRVSSKEASLPEVSVLRYDGKSLLRGVVPYGAVRSLTESNLSNMDRVREQVGQSPAQPGRHVLIEEKLHAGMLASRRSRSAAKARQARMSSRVRSGKSCKTSSSLMPEARE